MENNFADTDADLARVDYLLASECERLCGLLNAALDSADSPISADCLSAAVHRVTGALQGTVHPWTPWRGWSRAYNAYTGHHGRRDAELWTYARVGGVWPAERGVPDTCRTAMRVLDLSVSNLNWSVDVDLCWGRVLLWDESESRPVVNFLSFAHLDHPGREASELVTMPASDVSDVGGSILRLFEEALRSIGRETDKAPVNPSPRPWR